MYLTLQQIFDKAVSGIIKQGCLSLTVQSGPCWYRLVKEGGAVVSCPVGHLIPETHYTPDFETIDVATLIDPSYLDNRPTYPRFCEISHKFHQAMALSGVDVNDEEIVKLLVNLQECHDGAGSPEEFSQRAIWLAEELGLSYGVCLPQNQVVQTVS